MTGQPVPGVSVKAEGATAITDQEGIAVLRVQREPDDDGSIDVAARIGDFTSTGESTPLPNSRDTVRAYTDKPIYQPGQTMHVRILAMDASGKVKAGEEYEVRIVDESDDLVHSAKLKTSRFGVASTDWEIQHSRDGGECGVVSFGGIEVVLQTLHQRITLLAERMPDGYCRVPWTESSVARRFTVDGANRTQPSESESDVNRLGCAISQADGDRGSTIHQFGPRRWFHNRNLRRGTRTKQYSYRERAPHTYGYSRACRFRKRLTYSGREYHLYESLASQ